MKKSYIKKKKLTWISLHFEAKITKSKRSEKFKAKNNEKNEKNAKKCEKFEAKITQVKRSEKFEAKRSEKREVKFYSEIMNTCETDPNSLYFAYKRKIFLSETGSPYVRRTYRVILAGKYKGNWEPLLKNNF